MAPPPAFVGRARLSGDVRVKDVPVIERDHVTLRKGLHPTIEQFHPENSATAAACPAGHILQLHLELFFLPFLQEEQ